MDFAEYIQIQASCHPPIVKSISLRRLAKKGGVGGEETSRALNFAMAYNLILWSSLSTAM